MDNENGVKLFFGDTEIVEEVAGKLNQFYVLLKDGIELIVEDPLKIFSKGRNVYGEWEWCIFENKKMVKLDVVAELIEPKKEEINVSDYSGLTDDQILAQIMLKKQQQEALENDFVAYRARITKSQAERSAKLKREMSKHPSRNNSELLNFVDLPINPNYQKDLERKALHLIKSKGEVIIFGENMGSLDGMPMGGVNNDGVVKGEIPVQGQMYE